MAFGVISAAAVEVATATPSKDEGEAAVSVAQQKTQDDLVYNLPGGWIKRLIQRKSGASQGVWDVYLTSPDGTRLRSNLELIRYLAKNKHVEIDGASGANFDKTFVTGGVESEVTKRTTKLIEWVRGDREIPEGEDAEAVLSKRRRKRRKAVEVQPPQTNGNQQKKTVSKRSAKRPFSKLEERHLTLQFHRLSCQIPDDDWCISAALKFKVSPEVIHDWFLSHQETLVKDSGSRKLLSFDIVLGVHVNSPPIHDVMMDGEYAIEKDNAERDW